MYSEALVKALVGKPEDALKPLKLALEKGYSAQEAWNDPELQKLQSLPQFAQLVKQYSPKIIIFRRVLACRRHDARVSGSPVGSLQTTSRAAGLDRQERRAARGAPRPCRSERSEGLVLDSARRFLCIHTHASDTHAQCGVPPRAPVGWLENSPRFSAGSRTRETPSRRDD